MVILLLQVGLKLEQIQQRFTFNHTSMCTISWQSLLLLWLIILVVTKLNWSIFLVGKHWACAFSKHRGPVRRCETCLLFKVSLCCQTLISVFRDESNSTGEKKSRRKHNKKLHTNFSHLLSKQNKAKARRKRKMKAKLPSNMRTNADRKKPKKRRNPVGWSFRTVVIVFVKFVHLETL